ncbi:MULTISPECIES: 16S rRNA (guanine(966)-N(2))-methyltransferase RsmD [unclassified Psychrobacter]|uniref:16S rRNA (guanine(966)-N(2))-methyltransferase RsmD n=1 Tax=unclassified Psychrobacter TaxID=196806 RepID=UPI003FD43453
MAKAAKHKNRKQKVSTHTVPANTRRADHQAVSNVRIIGGQYKRRGIGFIDSEGLRPTPDRLRETLFNWLLADIHDARVLDSCAGSGVLGFESLSRGAAYCTFIETSRAQSQMLIQSAKQLNITPDNYHVINGAAEQVLMNMPDSPFDVVFIDPPYADDLWQPILSALLTQSLITRETLIYLEADKDLRPQLEALAINLRENSAHVDIKGFDCIKHTQVGQVVAGLYQLSLS